MPWLLSAVTPPVFCYHRTMDAGLPPPPDPPRRRSLGEWLAGSDRWHRWSPARRLAFCAMVPLQFTIAFVATVIIGTVLLAWAGVIH